MYLRFHIEICITRRYIYTIFMLSNPWARVRIPVRAWMFPCVVQLGVKMAHPPCAPSQDGHYYRRPPGPRAYRSRASPLDTKNIFMLSYYVI